MKLLTTVAPAWAWANNLPFSYALESSRFPGAGKSEAGMYLSYINRE